MVTVVLVDVRELDENLSKLPLGRASGALLESQLERSIAGYRVHPGCNTRLSPGFPATPTTFGVSPRVTGDDVT